MTARSPSSGSSRTARRSPVVTTTLVLVTEAGELLTTELDEELSTRDVQDNPGSAPNARRSAASPTARQVRRYVPAGQDEAAVHGQLDFSDEDNIAIGVGAGVL